jgi:hypothetical protein
MAPIIAKTAGIATAMLIALSVMAHAAPVEQIVFYVH